MADAHSTTSLNEPVATPRRLDPAAEALFDMEEPLIDLTRLVWAAVTIVDFGEMHDLEREQIAGLNVLLRVVHDKAQTIQHARAEGWRASTAVLRAAP